MFFLLRSLSESHMRQFVAATCVFGLDVSWAFGIGCNVHVGFLEAFCANPISCVFPAGRCFCLTMADCLDLAVARLRASDTICAFDEIMTSFDD